VSPCSPNPCLYLLEQSHPVHSPLQVQTDLPSTSTVQDPSFRQGLGEQGLTEILSFYINSHQQDINQSENRKKIRGGSKLSKKKGTTAFFGSSIGCLDEDLAKNPSQL
jgi:hypothetical protein